jgi:hypothetical protein
MRNPGPAKDVFAREMTALEDDFQVISIKQLHLIETGENSQGRRNAFRKNSKNT